MADPGIFPGHMEAGEDHEADRDKRNGDGDDERSGNDSGEVAGQGGKGVHKFHDGTPSGGLSRTVETMVSIALPHKLVKKGW